MKTWKVYRSNGSVELIKLKASLTYEQICELLKTRFLDEVVWAEPA